MCMAVLVTVLYFLPVLYIGWIGFYDAGDAYKENSKVENAILRFADWFYMIMLRADLGTVGLVISVLIHL